jgi:hypothetical protein
MPAGGRAKGRKRAQPPAFSFIDQTPRRGETVARFHATFEGGDHAGSRLDDPNGP